MPRKPLSNEVVEQSPHLTRGKRGIAGEVDDLRQDLKRVVTRIEEEFMYTDEQIAAVLSYSQTLMDNVRNPRRRVQLACADGVNISISAKASEANEFSYVLQDDKSYTYVAPATFNINTDLVGCSRQKNTQYYAYLIPADETSLVVKGFTDAPPSGPSGFTAWKYIGSIGTEKDGTIGNFSRNGDTVRLHSAKRIERLSNSDMQKAASDAVAVSIPYIPKTASAVLLRAIATSDALDGGLITFHVDGMQNKGSISHVLSKAGTDQSPTSFTLPIVDTSDPKFYRHIYDFSKCEFCQYQMFLLGWIDRYV